MEHVCQILAAHPAQDLEIRDALIAGIVAARKASLATHTTRHFEGLDLTLIDPWSP